MPKKARFGKNYTQYLSNQVILYSKILIIHWEIVHIKPSHYLISKKKIEGKTISLFLKSDFFQNFLEKLEQNIAKKQGWLNINIDSFQTKQVITYFFPVFGRKIIYLKYYNILIVVLCKFSHKIFLRTNVF